MINEKIEIWKKEEYHYPAAHGFIPVMFSYIHEDEKKHPAMIIAPGGAYREVSPSEAHLPAMEFYGAGYNVFVLEYTINQLDEAPLKMQPLHDISRAIRMIRSRAEEFHIRPDRIAACGFSAGAHLCGSLCVHNKDVEDPEEAYQNISNRPDVAILSYPVITSGKYAHRDSFVALFGKEPSEQELDYMSLENHVTKDTPPCFLWQTVTDQTVPVQNSYLFAQACAKAGEQVQMLVEVIEAGETPFPKEKGEELLVKFGIGRKKPARWTEKQKEGIRKTLKEVQSWTQLAEVWMEKYLKVE